MTEYQEFMVFEVEETGETNKINIEMEELKFYLHPEKTLIIVREDLRKIYLWKGAKAPVRKRFVGSRAATSTQGDLMKNGYHRCKILSIDQGDELEEFLNVFGLESMKVEEKLEDKYYVLNSVRDRLKEEQILGTKIEHEGKSKLTEIEKYLDKDEKILWIKSSQIKLSDNWSKDLLKNKKYKDRIKEVMNKGDIEDESYEKREVVTEKRLITSNKINKYYDFSVVPERFLKKEDEIVILDLDGLLSFDIEESKDKYRICFNVEPKNKGDCVFIFENLTTEEYHKFIDIFTLVLKYRAEIPTQAGILTYGKK